MFIYLLAAVALAVWFGGGVVAGFVAPQAAFGVLADRAQAGSIAGIVLGRFAVIAMVSGAVYIVAWFLSRLGARPFKKRALVVVSLALLVMAASQFYITPQIAGLRLQMAGSGATPELQTRFDALHTLSVVLFGIQWLFAGIALVLHALRGQQSSLATR